MTREFLTAVPTLGDVTPTQGDTTVSVEVSTITVPFDLPPDPAAVNAVELLAQGEVVAITEPGLTNEQRTISFEPVGGLRAGTRYQVRVGAIAGGPRRQQDYEFSFSTTVPRLAQTDPEASAEINAADLTQLEVAFTSAVDADRVSGNFSLSRNGEAVELREGDPVALDATNTLFSLAPAGEWRVGSTYSLQIAADVFGPLGPGQSAVTEFLTAVPALDEEIPAAGSSDVAIADAQITVPFDIPPDPSITAEGVVELTEQGEVIAISVPSTNDGRTFTFEPIDGLRAGTRYQVRVGAVAGGPRRDGDYEWTFSTQVPEVDSSDPAAGSETNAADLTQVEIAFTAAVDADRVSDNFSLFRNGEVVALRDDDPVSLDTANRTFGIAPADDWQVGSIYSLQLASDLFGPLGPGQVEVIQFLTAVPALGEVTPAAGSGDVGIADALITLPFDIPPDPSITMDGVVELTEQGQVIAVTVPSTNDGQTFTFEPVGGLRAGTRYQVSIPASVGGPRNSDAYTWQFDTQVPGLLSTEPQLREENVHVDSSVIRLQFSAPIDAGLLSSENFNLFREGDAVELAGGDPRELGAALYGLQPASGRLEVGSRYILQVAPVVTGPLGLNQPIIRTFSTAFPSEVALSPPRRAADVATSDSRISITFDNPVDVTAAQDSSNIDLLWESTTVAITPPSYNDDTRTLSFEPIGGLVAGSNYIVRIDGAIGGPLRRQVGDFVWRFSTRLPFLANTRPDNGEEGVATSTTTIRMSFSDPIASTDPGNFQLFEQRLGRGPEPEVPNPRALIPSDVAAQGDTVVNLSPRSGFHPFSEYTVIIGRDALGPLATGGDSLVFQTAGRLGNAAAGGIVENPGGTVELYFPPNALDAAAEVVIQRLDDEIAEKALVQEEPRRVSPAYLIDVGGAPLRKPVTLSMRFRGDEPGGSDSSRLAIFRQADGSWQRVGGTAAANEPVIRTAVEELGTFAIFEDLAAAVGRLAVRDLDCQPRAFSPRSGDKRETDISFTLTGPADVTVRVYNASGRLERVIERDRSMSQGRVLLAWDGQDEDREMVASGLYIVVVNAGGAQREKVVAVVR